MADLNVLLFAAGHADESGQVTAGLWRSEDAGAAWARVTGKIDFRGDQATALCGEVIALDQADPKFVVAGGDRVGVMVNEDGGLKRLVRQDRA